MAVVKPLYKKLILWTALVLQIAIIFSFSLQNSDKSGDISGWFTDGIKSQEKIEMEVAAEKTDNGEPKYHENSVKNVARGKYALLQYYVRKSAHISLFFLLGTILILLLKSYKITGVTGYVSVLLFGTAVGFFDEILQLFTKGRAGLLVDVFIDAVGVVIAIAVFYVGGLVYEKNKNRRTKMDN